MIDGTVGGLQQGLCELSSQALSWLAGLLAGWLACWLAGWPAKPPAAAPSAAAGPTSMLLCLSLHPLPRLRPRRLGPLPFLVPGQNILLPAQRGCIAAGRATEGQGAVGTGSGGTAGRPLIATVVR